MAAHVQTVISEAQLHELQERRIAVDSSLGTTLAEGVPPTAAAMAFAEQYASGEIRLEEYGRSVRALHGI